MKRHFFAALILSAGFLGLSGNICAEPGDMNPDPDEVRPMLENYYAGKLGRHAFNLTADIALLALLADVVSSKSLSKLWADGRYGRLAVAGFDFFAILVLISDAVSQVGHVAQLASQKKAALDMLEAKSRENKYLKEGEKV